MTVQTEQADPVLTEIEELRTRQREIRDRITHLQRLRSRPTVIPVLVYDRHHSHHEESASCWDDPIRDNALEDAYTELEVMSDMGRCYAIGVSVNGVLISRGDLQDRFGYLS